MKLNSLRPRQQLRHWQRSAWRQVDFRWPLGCGVLMHVLLLGALLTRLPSMVAFPLLGFALLAAYQGYEQPAAPSLVAAVICLPLFLMVLLLALVLPDGRVAATWLAIAIIILLLCLAGAHGGTWLHGRRHGI